MQVTSRVVCRDDEHRGLTGTIMGYCDSIITVALDCGVDFQCTDKDILEIDDITNIGNIDFKVGMDIYDVQFDMVGRVVSVEDQEELFSHTIEFEDGKVLSYPLVEEFNFVVIK